MKAMNVDGVQWLKALAPCPCWDTNQALRLCLGTKATGADFGAVSALSINHDCSRLLCGFAKGQVLFHDVFVPSQPRVIIVIPRAWFDQQPVCSLSSCETHPIISEAWRCCTKMSLAHHNWRRISKSLRPVKSAKAVANFYQFFNLLLLLLFFTHAHIDSVGFRAWKKFLIFCPCLFCNAHWSVNDLKSWEVLGRRDSGDLK